MSNPYMPIIAIMCVAGVMALGGVIASWNVGPHRFNRAKLDAYECGIDPSPLAQGGGRFPIRFYLVAMSFILFDLEVVFLYPWATNYSSLGMFGFVVMMIFLFLITVPFVYEWSRGGLDWN